MKIRTRWIFTIILCLLIAIPLAACDVSTATPSGTLESQNGVTIEGTFEDGAALEAVEVVGEDKILALQSIAEEKYDTDGKVYVYDISVVKDGAKVQPSGKVKVTVSVPDIDTSKTYTVYHIKDDGAVEKIKPTVQSGKVIFETDGFSCFIIAPDAQSGGEIEEPKKQVNVSINILPLAECGMLKVNGTLYENAASYKTTHTEGERITVEAIATSGHHFGFWGEDEVLSRQPVYEFTVGAENISFAANFTGHDVQYSEITDDAHTEKCKFGDYTQPWRTRLQMKKSLPKPLVSTRARKNFPAFAERPKPKKYRLQTTTIRTVFAPCAEKRRLTSASTPTAWQTPTARI